MKKLSELPNVGKVTIKRLANIGIYDAEELIKLGSKETYKRLLKHEGDTCLDTLYGLEGAIKGIRWHDLSINDRKELKEFFDEVNNKK